MTFLKRAADLAFLRFQLAQPGFDEAQLGLALLDQLAGFDQPTVDALALGGELVHLGLQFLGAALRGLQPSAIGFELFAGLLGVGRDLRAGQRRHQHGGHQQGPPAPT